MTEKLRVAAKQALEALQMIYIAPEHEEYIRVWWPACAEAITSLRAALAEPEPVQEHGDWDRVVTLEESLREHMKEIQRLRAQRDALLEALRPFAKTDLTIPTVRDTFGFDVLFARAAIAKAEGKTCA